MQLRNHHSQQNFKNVALPAERDIDWKGFNQATAHENWEKHSELQHDVT